MWGRPLAWSTARIWALQAGGADEPGVIWCGTLPGGLFRSSDHGDSWEMVRSLWDHPKRKQWMGGGADLPGIHSILVDPRNSKRVWVAVSTGGIWFTEDAGASWTQRGEGMRAEYVPPELTHDPIAQDVHCLAQCPAAPQRMWVQHHNGIFVSSDEGKRFNEITGVEPSTFGFPVVVHPLDPDTAWFVPEIKDEKRIPTRRPARRHPHARRRQEFRRVWRTACRRGTPTTSSTATRWRSMRPATGWHSARRPAACG